MKNNLFELLAPAGDLEKAKVAFDYGADAIFLGAKIFSLRARASNFSYEDIDYIINYAHNNNKKVYIVANVLAHNNLLNELDQYLKTITKYKPDGFIVADPAIIYKLRNEYPDSEIHISTQQSITNSKSALFWKRNSATRVVLARELTYDEIEQLVKNVNNQIEIEIFIHGAVCISYSGRCMMSNNFSLRDANVGGCAQSCRWTYEVLNDDIKNKSKYFTMSAKDMAQIDNLEKLMKLNIASFKIEGRMKSLHYIANVIKNYRLAIDKIKVNNLNLVNEKNELLKSANREFDTAFLSGTPDYTKMLYHDTHIDLSQKFVFIIYKKLENNFYEALVKNHFDINDQIEIMTKENLFKNIKIKEIINEANNEKLLVCPTPMMKIKIKFDNFNEDIKNEVFGRIM